MNNPLIQLEAYGQSVWLDCLRRSLIDKGKLRFLIEKDGLKGVTSTPSIFEKAIGETEEYAYSLKRFPANSDHSVSAIYEHLAVADIRAGADVLRPVYDQTRGRDGYIGVVKATQARGDLEAMVERGRRALRVHLKDVAAELAELEHAMEAALK
ncbi:transaldolase family protein [Mesorhizobium sp. ANAO-SY3R2]|uniref:transaldolase family protein n=1 Tax=Mesorhizobium sp. ANAO-SY3R2 TaxID=3166644 RepID=UPI00366D43FB